jgi:succinoglycan biosynthesis transport protein ExoP
MNNLDRDETGHEVLSIDLKKIIFSIRLYRMFLVLCTLAMVSFTSVYVAFIRVESYRSEMVLKMAASAPSSALSTLLASLNATESATAKLESLNELLGSNEFGSALAERAYRDKNFFVEFVHTEHLKPHYRNERKPASDGPITDGEADQAPSNDLSKELSDDFKESFARVLTSSLQFVPDQRSSTLSVLARTRKPWLSAQLAELAGTTIVELNYKRKMAQITSLKNFLSKQLQDNGEKLNTFEATLAEYQRSHGLLNESGAGNPTLVRYTKVQEDIEDVKRLLAANVDRIQIHEKELGEFRAHLGDPAFYKSNVYLTQLQYRMRTLAYELDLAKSGENGPATEVETLKTELDTLGKTYRDALNKSAEGKSLPVASPTEYYQDLEKGLHELKKERNLLLSRYKRAQNAFGTLKVEADRLPDQMRDLASVKRNISLTSTIYLDTEKKLQEVRFMEAETVNDLSVLYRAKMPETPDNISMLRLFVIMGIVGLLMGGLTVLRLEVFAQTIRSRKDMDKHCDRFLGVVPRIDGETRSSALADMKPTLKYLKDSLIPVMRYPATLILEKDPDGADADNFRSLRMHLFKLIKEDRAFAGNPCKVIMITSPSENSGRTFLAANLALTLAKADLKTLLVDLDLRKPDLYEFFPKCTPTNAEKVFSKGELEKSIQPYSSKLSLLLLRGQTSHPPEILESHELQEFFAKAREQYDFIIFDSPAVLTTVDPTISSSLADLIVMTVESEKTKRDEFDGAIRKIRNCNDRPIYGVLNFSDRRRDAVA